jgi:hypothetical protein
VSAAGSAQRPQLQVYLIAFADARHGFASLTDPKMPCRANVCVSFLQRSSDGGRSWSPTLRGPVSLNAHVQVSTVPGTSAVWAYFPCTESSCRPLLYRSSDWGRQWHLIGHPRLERLRFFSPRDGWALTAKWILVVTHDGGRSWRRAPRQPCPPENPADVGVMAIAPVSGRHGWALCTDRYLPEQRAGVYETRDGSRSWHVRALRGSVPPLVGRGAQNFVALLDLSFDTAGRGWIWAGTGHCVRPTADILGDRLPAGRSRGTRLPSRGAPPSRTRSRLRS